MPLCPLYPLWPLWPFWPFWPLYPLWPFWPMWPFWPLCPLCPPCPPGPGPGRAPDPLLWGRPACWSSQCCCGVGVELLCERESFTDTARTMLLIFSDGGSLVSDSPPGQQ